jgi:hypothetical protein
MPKDKIILKVQDSNKKIVKIHSRPNNLKLGKEKVKIRAETSSYKT